LNRKTRQLSAPSKIHRNPDIEQLKQNIETKKAQRVTRQQQIRETLSSLSMASVPPSGRNTSFVCVLFSFHLILWLVYLISRQPVMNGIVLIN
jgi:hypothetical protein